MHLFLAWGTFLRAGSGDGASSNAAVDMEGQRSNCFLQFLSNGDHIEPNILACFSEGERNDRNGKCGKIYSTQNSKNSKMARNRKVQACHSRSRIFQMGGSNTKFGDTNLLFWPIIFKNCIKIKKNWTEGRCTFLLPHWIRQWT